MTEWIKDESIALHKPLCANCKHFTEKPSYESKRDIKRINESICIIRGSVHPNYGCIEFVGR